MKTMYRVIKNGFSLSDTCLINETYLADFIYQYREVNEILLIENSGQSLIKVQSGEVVHCSESGVKAQLNKAIQSLEEQAASIVWRPLNLYRFEIEVFLIETYYLFSREQEQAEREFAEWSIFDAINVQHVA